MISTLTNTFEDIDVRVRLLVMLLLSVVVFLLHSEAALFLLLCSACLWSCLFGPGRQCLRYAVFYLLLWALLQLSGTLRIGGSLPVLTVYLRRVLIPVIAALPVSSAPLGRFIASLCAMHLPRAGVLAVAVLFRFLPTIGQEYTAIRHAQKFRGIGLSPSGLLFHPLKTLEYTMIPLLIRTSRIADDLSASAMVRGMRINGKVSSLHAVKFHWQDFCTLAVWLIVIAAVYFFDITGGRFFL